MLFLACNGLLITLLYIVLLWVATYVGFYTDELYLSRESIVINILLVPASSKPTVARGSLWNLCRSLVGNYTDLSI
jgi:hypothetical protein